MGKIRILSFLIVVALTLQSQAQSKRVETDTSFVKVYLAIADEHWNKDQLDSSLHYCLKAGAVARKTNYQRGIAEYISFHIPILNRLGEYQEALKLGLEGVKICQSLNDKVLLAQAYNNLANEYHYLGDLKSAATHYLNALVFSEGTNMPRRQQRYSNNLAAVFLQLKETTKSLHYATKSYELALANNDSVGMASSLVNLASNEVMTKKYDDAIRHLDQVLLLGQALKDDSYVMDSYINRADIEAEKKNYAGALQYYQRSLNVLKRYPADDYELYIHWGMAKSYFSMKKLDKALHHLNKSVALAKSLSASHELLNLYQLGSDINEAMSHFETALSMRKSYEHLNDSLVNLETQQNIHRLETEYRTAQKEKALAEQQLTIAKNTAEIEKKDRLITLSFVLVSASVLVIIFSVWAFRNKQRANEKERRLLEKQNELKLLNATIEGEEKERARLARELHDGVGGILSASKMHLSALTYGRREPTHEKLTDVISLIDVASREIRTIAHNLAPEMVSENNLENAVANFCKRVDSPHLKINHFISSEIPALKPDFKLLVYRCIQELVNNIIKHAEATEALVQLTVHDNLLLLTVEDNGKGFDIHNATGLGLINLKKRVADANGTIDISSSEGNGTTVNLEFDISKFTDEKVLETTTLTI